MCARRFLIAIIIVTLLVVAGAFAIFKWGDRVLLNQAVPKGHFEGAKAGPGPDYTKSGTWVARPDMPDDPSRWLPTGMTATAAGKAAVFYIHPTTYLTTEAWNAPLKPGGDTEFRTGLFVQSQASAFNGAGQIWAPRYRQAAYGAFLLKSEDAQKALDLAYGDVAAAFAEFIREAPANGPIILAGHSQGALHLERLLREKVAGQPIAKRVVAAYVAGWPISTTADLAALGLPACAAPEQSGCILSWMTFADPPNPDFIFSEWNKTRGFNGGERRREDTLCVNPISGMKDGSESAAENPGTLIPAADMRNATLQAGARGSALRQGAADPRRDAAAARFFRSAGQQLPCVRLCVVLGRDPARRAAEAGGMASLITVEAGEFGAALPDGGKLAGLDVGTKTIGLSICDAGWHFAGPAETIRRTKFTQDLEQLRAFIAREHVLGLVVGLPLNMDGGDSPRTQSVRAFARNLAPLDLPLLLWDERWSTQAVERAMIDADVSRAKRAEKVDALAAAHILQGAIDALANLNSPQ